MKKDSLFRYKKQGIEYLLLIFFIIIEMIYFYNIELINLVVM